MKNTIKLSREQRENLITEIQTYFLEERDEDLGDLAASLVLDFFLQKLGPEIYNQAIYDAYKYMQDRVEDLLGIQK